MVFLINRRQFLEILFYSKQLKSFNKLEQRSTIAIIHTKSHFDGFSGVLLTEISLVPKNADTLFSVQNEH
jgi:hypothetical protein